MFRSILLTAVTLSCLSPHTVRGEAPQSPQELLNRLVAINSHSLNTTGINQLRSLLIPEFEKLGFTARTHTLEKNHLLTSLDFPGEKPTLLLVGHLDTVFPEAAPRGKVGTQGDRIYGPGIIDMKGGIVVILKALERLSPGERRKVRVILNDDEEQASAFSRHKLRELAEGIPYGLVFEPGLPDGSLVTSSSGGRWIKLSVKGKSAHAGLEHQKGLNACTELAHKLIQLHALTDYSRRLTLNVGVLEGGTQPNVVCEEASAKLDVRYVNPKDLDGLLAKIQKISEEAHLQNAALGLSPTASLETLVEVPSMPEPTTRTLFAIAQQEGKKLGLTINGQHVGYATDANHLVQTGMELLVGLGPYGGGMHTDQEFMLRNSLEERIVLAKQLIREVLSNFYKEKK